MTHHRVRDAAHQGSAYSAHTPASHHDQPRVELFAQPDYLLVGASQPEMSPSGYFFLGSNAFRLLLDEGASVLFCLLEAPLPPLSGEGMRVRGLGLGGHAESYVQFGTSTLRQLCGHPGRRGSLLPDGF